MFHLLFLSLFFVGLFLSSCILILIFTTIFLLLFVSFTADFKLSPFVIAISNCFLHLCWFLIIFANLLFVFSLLFFLFPKTRNLFLIASYHSMIISCINLDCAGYIFNNSNFVSNYENHFCFLIWPFPSFYILSLFWKIYL